MEDLTFSNIFTTITAQNKPAAIAWLHGNVGYPDLCGRVLFFHTPFGGILVSGEIYGLPKESGFFGMHIHEYGNCSLPFDKTGGHYNPTGQMHPYHAGDMPSLLGNDGYAFTAFFDNRLTIEEIIGKSLIIHSMRDDFTSQPAGDSGSKIACGVITKL